VSHVAVIGPGRAGTLLALASARAGHRVVAVGGGGARSRERLAALVAGVRPEQHPADAARRAELVLLCVPDDVLEDVVTHLALEDGVGDGQRVVHVSGSQGLRPLRRARLAGARVAACHPAMTIPAGSHDPRVLVGTAWAVTAAPDDLVWARELVGDLGGDPHEVPDAARVLYHAGLVVGANAVGAVVSIARRLLLAARVEAPEVFLAPLVEASVANVLQRGAQALTGPVVRGDHGTIATHLDALDRDVPELAEAYRVLSEVVLSQVRAGMDPDVAARLESLLEEER
jgi:predicted short-subunit dehydrogenase-like oxidoreductase (DUF2520 family)